MKFSEKQKEVLRCIKYENPKILISSGAKRARQNFRINLCIYGSCS